MLKQPQYTDIESSNTGTLWEWVFEYQSANVRFPLKHLWELLFNMNVNLIYYWRYSTVRSAINFFILIVLSHDLRLGFPYWMFFIVLPWFCTAISSVSHWMCQMFYSLLGNMATFSNLCWRDLGLCTFQLKINEKPCSETLLVFYWMLL